VTRLIKLYPPAWRRRYGRELAELMPPSRRRSAAMDLVAAAVDAWLNLSSTAATADAKGTGVMISKMLQLKCAATVRRSRRWTAARPPR
jgi:hypothetical protein